MAVRFTQAVRCALRDLSQQDAELIYRASEGYSIAGITVSQATATNLARLHLIHASHGRIGEYYASVLAPRGRAFLQHPGSLPEMVLAPARGQGFNDTGEFND